MFNHEEEDRDLDSQAAKGQQTADDTNRGAREETPEPEASGSTQQHQVPKSSEINSLDPSSSNTTEHPDPGEATKPQVIPESALPDKIVTSPSTQKKQ